MKQSYMDYAMSVIVGRALPDVRDGLKPVHRRILFAMHEMGLLHNKPFKKSATVVGTVLGKYHPHGDMAVYDSLVRMAQPWSLRYLLVKGQGNFGSQDGDSPAAYRYTEAKLSKIAEELLQDIDKETVKFVPNFDGSLEEPSVLPSKFPNLLVNGSSGIAVGMATNVPPHNIIEICDGIIKTIDNPDIELGELMQYISGPDFPTGAIICGRQGIKDAYSSGRGHIKVRAKVTLDNEKKRLIITEIPYMVNKSQLTEEIARLVNDKRIRGIADIRDESDREGMRLIIELRQDAIADVVLNQLYKHTRLQDTFGIIMLALVNNEPKILSLKALIQNYICYRQVIVRKRTEFELRKAEKRAHILAGLLIALKDIDSTIRLIKESKSVDEAKTALIASLDITEEQSLAILDMKLQRLTSLEQERIANEHKDLLNLIEELKAILASEQKILEIIKNELEEIKRDYGDERRTEIIEDEKYMDVEDLIKSEDNVITITHAGYIKRLPTASYRQQRRGGKGVVGVSAKEEDFIEEIFIANTLSYLLFFTNKGKVHWLKVYTIPEAGRQAKGKAVINLLQLEENEKITAFVPVSKFDDLHYLIMATKKGTIKKTNLDAYSNPRKGGIIAITLDEGDELIGVVLTDGNKQIMLATKNGAAVRFKEATVRPTGRSARGVRGATLREDEVIGLVVANDEQSLLTITENGYGKRSKVAEYRLTNRGGIGVRNIICSERNGKAVTVKSVSDNDQLMLISQKGIIIRMPVQDIRVIGRNTQGVRLINLDQGDKVVAAAKIIKEEEPKENGNGKKEDSKAVQETEEKTAQELIEAAEKEDNLNNKEE